MTIVRKELRNIKCLILFYTLEFDTIILKWTFFAIFAAYIPEMSGFVI